MMSVGVITSPKVVIPSALFALLSPGILLQLPEKIPFMNANAIGTMKTSRMSIFFHALVFIIMFKMVSKFRGIVLKPSDILVSALLFVLLSPGMLLSIPSTTGKLFGSSTFTGYPQVLVHTLVYAIVFSFLRSAFPQVY